MSSNWSNEQQFHYMKIAEISHKLAHQGAEKALKDAGLWPCSYGAFANIEDRMAEAIRRGAIETLILLNSTPAEWAKREFNF